MLPSAKAIGFSPNVRTGSKAEVPAHRVEDRLAPEAEASKQPTAQSRQTDLAEQATAVAAIVHGERLVSYHARVEQEDVGASRREILQPACVSPSAGNAK
jgi:hypothetical protein